MHTQDRETIIDRREMLKVKIKSLAAESKMIRREEQAQKAANSQHRQHIGVKVNSYASELILFELHEHRVTVVRPACRLAHLAYGLIRGRTLEQMENKSQPLTDQQKKQVKEMIRKYGPRQGFVLPDWLQDGETRHQRV